MVQPYVLSLRAGKLQAVIDTLGLDFNQLAAQGLGEAVRNAAEVVRTRAVWNVGGNVVVYEGGVFRVMVRTGALKGAMEVQWPYGNALVARVFVNGTHTSTGEVRPAGYSRSRPVSDYAGSIEWGHEEIDLKKTMMGKTVPFFASRGSNSRGPYTARGLDPLDSEDTGIGSRWKNDVLNAKLQARGKNPMYFRKSGAVEAYAKGGGSSFFIAFRKVGKEGWIIPRAEPRPFMKAAVLNTQTQVRRLYQREAAQVIRDALGDA